MWVFWRQLSTPPLRILKPKPRRETSMPERIHGLRYLHRWQLQEPIETGATFFAGTKTRFATLHMRIILFWRRKHEYSSPLCFVVCRSKWFLKHDWLANLIDWLNSHIFIVALLSLAQNRRDSRCNQLPFCSTQQSNWYSCCWRYELYCASTANPNTHNSCVTSGNNNLLPPLSTHPTHNSLNSHA